MRFLAAIRNETGLSCDFFLRKGELFAYPLGVVRGFRWLGYPGDTKFAPYMALKLIA